MYCHYYINLTAKHIIISLSQAQFRLHVTLEKHTRLFSLSTIENQTFDYKFDMPYDAVTYTPLCASGNNELSWIRINRFKDAVMY